ncbi:MAG: hypothetical protein H6659_10485 [Ardenticatenaceae bacterium]|nr:hypothetical protein [Ardenticatenaceae bacterium]MCB8987511.1 hypothetical protein [Ardenticatenaceae bacterium]
MMTRPNPKVDVYLEIGQKKVIAGAVEWPGWCRIARSEDEALQALLDYGPRYAAAIKSSGAAFQAPAHLSDLHVVERLEGSPTSDFGVPVGIPAADERPFTPADLPRAELMMQACWQAFETAVQAATGKTLTKGPRGGGRELDNIVEHVLGAQNGYLSRLAWKKPKQIEPASEWAAQIRQAELAALVAATRGEIPEQGPRGGKIWPARYFVRRSAWHILDHAWEIEDRAHIAGPDQPA